MVEVPCHEQSLGLRGSLAGVGNDVGTADSWPHHVADQQAQGPAERVELAEGGLAARGLDHIEASLGERPRPGAPQLSAVLHDRADRPAGVPTDARGEVQPALAGGARHEGKVEHEG